MCVCLSPEHQVVFLFTDAFLWYLHESLMTSSPDKTKKCYQRHSYSNGRHQKWRCPKTQPYVFHPRKDIFRKLGTAERAGSRYQISSSFIHHNAEYTGCQIKAQEHVSGNIRTLRGILWFFHIHISKMHGYWQLWCGEFWSWFGIGVVVSRGSQVFINQWFF